jgi:hypothetical protein
VKQRAKRYINGDICLEYIRMVLLPNLNQLRTLEEFADEDAVLLMDNCPAHASEEVLNLSLDARV